MCQAQRFRKLQFCSVDESITLSKGMVLKGLCSLSAKLQGEEKICKY